MKNVSKTLLTAAIVTAISMPAMAGKYRHDGNNYESNQNTVDYAKVVNVEPVVETYQVNNPVQHCWNERVQHRTHSRKSSYTPEVFGAVIGAAVGNRFGKGSGRDAATVAGALLGTTLARDVKHKHKPRYNKHNNGYQTVQRCETRDDYSTQERVVGYDVAYKYRGNVFYTQMDQRPGDKIKVRVSVNPV